MTSAMNIVFFALAFLVRTGIGKRVQTSKDILQNSPDSTAADTQERPQAHAKNVLDPFKGVALLLGKPSHTAAFDLAGPGAHLHAPLDIRTQRGTQPALQRANTIRNSVATATELTIPKAKEKLRAALAANENSPKHPDVVAAIDALATLSPTANPAKASDVLLGEWKVISAPEFPDQLGFDSEGNPKYTLGRMSFGLFEPKDLVCSITQIMNPLRVNKNGTIDYEVEVAFSSDEPGSKIKGKMLNFAELDVLSDDRVSVRFLGGDMGPADGSVTPEWEATFGKALQTAKRGFRDKISGWLMKKMMGLERPKEMKADGIMSYAMKKAPEGWLDIKYLDDELRITQGNRGSIVIAERVKEA